MSSVTFTKKSLTITDIIFTIMLLAIFTAELIITTLFSPLFSRLGFFYASLLDAAILIMLFALPLWFFVIQPISADNKLKWKQARGLPQLLFFAILTGIFLSEFLVMLALHFMIPQADAQILALIDACLATLCSAPLLWWVTYGKELQREQIHKDDLMATPIRLFALLVLMVFLADLLMDILAPYLSRNLSPVGYLLVDASLSTLFIAALLWEILIKPLRRRSLSQKALINAVYTQAVDAFVTIDAEGTILSFNPAAERIFGYSADELIGMKGALLFVRGQQDLDFIIDATEQSGVNAVSHEVEGIRRDGALLTIDVSISRMLLDNRLKLLIIMRDISERKAMEKAVQVSEERLSLAVNGANDGIWDWDVQSGEVYYCPRFKELLGYRVDEMEHTFAAFESRLHPDDHARVIEAVRRHLEENLPYDVQYRLRNSGGVYHWYRARGLAVRDPAGKPLRMAGSISDITIQKKALEALRESEIRFRQIFEQSEDAVIFFKPGGCVIIDINATAEKLFGYAKTELKDAGLELVTDPADLPLLINAISNISPDSGNLLESVGCICRDGREIIVSMRGKVMTLQNVNLVYCTFRDVTERLHMEQAAREIQSKLIQINKMTSLGLMVSGVAHEINNPNNFIMANSQLLKKSWLDALTILREYYRENGDYFVGGVPFSELEPRSPELFDGILEGSKRINAIIDNLKKFARNDLSLDNSTFDVNQVVSSAITILHFELNKFTRKFHVELTENIPRVKGSGQQLGQIIINLLMNACQSLPDSEHGIWLTTGMNAGADQVILSVRDEGQGMSPERSKLIMEPFFTTKLDSGGTGLGLSICRSIANDHSWSIDFTSEQGKGSTFTLRIPLDVTSDEEPSHEK